MLIWSWITLLYLECQDSRFAGLIILAGNHLCINSVSTKREQNLTKSCGEKLSNVVDALTVCTDESASFLKWTVTPLLCFASVQSSSEWSSCSRDSTWSACSITSSIMCWIGFSVAVSSILDSSCTTVRASKIRPCSTYWYDLECKERKHHYIRDMILMLNNFMQLTSSCNWFIKISVCEACSLTTRGVVVGALFERLLVSLRCLFIFRYVY